MVIDDAELRILVAMIQQFLILTTRTSFRSKADR